MLLNFLYDHMYPYPGVKCIRNKSKGETIMNDMQFAKYSCDIREILGNMTEKDQFANLVRNAVASERCIRRLRNSSSIIIFSDSQVHRFLQKMQIKM